MAQAAEAMEHFGTYLRRQREARGMTLAELSRATKIKEANLAAIEEARLEALPARVFVIGYVGVYARAVGADPAEALSRLRTHAPDHTPVPIGDCMPKVVARAPEPDDVEGRPMAHRRLGVALVVFLLLIVATLTISLLLRHGGHVGGPMS